MNTWYRNFDFVTFFCWVALVGIGLVAIYSTTHGPASEFLPASVQQNFYRQFTWLGICLMGIVIALFLPVRFYQSVAYPAYVLCLLLLIAALAFGREINGARSWVHIGPVGFQVAELAKVGTLLALAKLLSGQGSGQNDIRQALLAIGLLVIPVGLILMQNDTGTALVFLGLVPVVLYWSGIPLNILALMLSPAVAGYLAIVYMPAAIVFAMLFTAGLWWQSRDRIMGSLGLLFNGGAVAVVLFGLNKILQPHQVTRILIFTNPEQDPFNAGFQQVQSKVAIGSGGLFGKGFMQGTQTQGSYVSEQSTDFVFSVIAEEFGFLGAMLVLGLFALLMIRLVTLITQIKHPFALIFIAGTVGVYLIHIFINVGMATSLLPVIGIPLPFISYGGSALLANTAMLAIALALYMRREDFSIYGY